MKIYSLIKNATVIFTIKSSPRAEEQEGEAMKQNQKGNENGEADNARASRRKARSALIITGRRLSGGQIGNAGPILAGGLGPAGVTYETFIAHRRGLTTTDRGP